MQKQQPTDHLASFGARLSGVYNTLNSLRGWINSELDPNRTGYLGVGEFMCLWVMGSDEEGAHPGGVLAEDVKAKVAAVAAAVAARVLTKESFVEVISGGKEVGRDVWYGRNAGWRGRNPALDGDGCRRTTSNRLNHVNLVVMRRIFEEYEEIHAPGTIRFGAISGFLTAVSHHPQLSRAFYLPPSTINAILDDLVKHTAASLPAGPWTEPTFPFITLLSLVFKHTSQGSKPAALAFFNTGLTVFHTLSNPHTDAAVSPARREINQGESILMATKNLLRCLALSCQESFRDAGSPVFLGPQKAW
eukprot:TRINITY_DN33832_c0_g1_i1.p1 TRINITY_DN33832_c0_g1~~TRINITY_DN33832_c0_g1_i1.p1  ORF type:complete len:304 (+),score=57.05 TRINITY_DN33832_c0_g1_i1:61-972(+)